MKVRTGFVSNSSSSSFAIVMSKNDYNAALSEMPEDIQEFINNHCPPESKFLEGAAGGLDVVLVTGIHGDEHYLNGTKFMPRPDDREGPFNRYNAISKVISIFRGKPHMFTEVDS
jgi:hypothetical protein